MATQLLDLTEDAIEALLPLLPWNDLLRFRRVCKMTHRITTKYCQVYPQKAPEIQIDEKGERNLGAFLDMGIPSTKIYLNNLSGTGFYEKNQADMEQFLKIYGKHVISLRVHQISLYPCIYGMERKILNSFPSLLHFEAGYFGVDHMLRQNPNGFIEDPTVNKRVVDPYPCRFECLKSLKIGQNPDVPICNLIARINGTLGRLSQLEHVSLPFSPSINDNLSEDPNRPVEPKDVYWFAFVFVFSGIDHRKKLLPENLNLLQVDFACYHSHQYELFGTKMFEVLCRQCLETGVKLRNVGASWFLLSHGPELGHVVKSLVNLNSCILSFEMPNLESVEIKATSKSGMSSEREWQRERPEWPSLKRLDITVDSKIAPEPRVNDHDEIERVEVPTKNIFDYCFKKIRRLALMELYLKFDKNDKNEVAMPNVNHIVESCPNLKKLTLVNWLGTNASLVRMWEGLTGLEEISLENCKNVGNRTFVGMDLNNPVFLKLKNLKKLSLKGLDKMPKITNTLFSLVIRHLNLTHLIITADKPIQSVTIAGIRTLLDGNFAASIEKFPFSNWSLEGVSEAEFKLLETQFRSYQMI